MSKLLINEPPIQVLPSLAVKIGLNEAIVLQQLHYWINKDSSHERDGRRWCYNTYEAWHKQFPFWCIRTIKTIFKSLQDKKLIIIGNYNKTGYDRTNWFSIDKDQMSLLDISPSCKSCTMEDANLAQPIPETTTEITCSPFPLSISTTSKHASMQASCSTNTPRARDTTRCNEMDNELADALLAKGLAKGGVAKKKKNKSCASKIYEPKCIVKLADALLDENAFAKKLADAGFAPEILKSDAGEQWKPKDSPTIQKLKDKWVSWGVNESTIANWISTKSEKYLSAITLDAEQRAKSNPGGFLRRLISDNHIPDRVETRSPHHEPKIDLYSRSENITWWNNHSSEQKHLLMEESLYKFPLLENRLQIDGVGFLAEEFTKRYTFKLLMEVLGRYETRTHNPSAKEMSPREVFDKLRLMIKKGKSESDRTKKR